MPVPILHEDDAEEIDLPGRRVRWLVADDRIKAEHCSSCVIWVKPGEKVRPAHSHPLGEDVIYIVSGAGRVLVGGDTSPVKAGSMVLFPTGVPHMLHNTGSEEMKVVCFFAPPTSLDNYNFHDDIDFPE